VLQTPGPGQYSIEGELGYSNGNEIVTFQSPSGGVYSYLKASQPPRTSTGHNRVKSIPK